MKQKNVSSIVTYYITYAHAMCKHLTIHRYGNPRLSNDNDKSHTYKISWNENSYFDNRSSPSPHVKQRITRIYFPFLPVHALHVVQTSSGVHPTSYPMGTGDYFPGVERQGREADHSPPTSAEVKKMWIHSPIRLHGVMLN
jgi:hypothetical protein